MVWECQACGYVHNEKAASRQQRLEGKPAKTEGLPVNWKCPVCGVGRKFFEEVSGRNS